MAGSAQVLREAYADADAVTDELVDVILRPGLEPGATEVFIDFLSYSSGPLPEALLAACPVPLGLLWGAADPWERVEWGRALAAATPDAQYVELPGVGHCPMDEAPDTVNPLVRKFVDANL